MLHSWNGREQQGSLTMSSALALWVPHTDDPTRKGGSVTKGGVSKPVFPEDPLVTIFTDEAS